MGDGDYVTDNIYLSGRVMRYATWPTLHQQSTGEHSHAVYLLYDQIFGRPPAEVARYIMYHDTAEIAVGDPPFPVKSKSPALKAEYDKLEDTALENMGIALPDISQEDKIRIKVCDLLEMSLFGMVERQMGNHLAVAIIHRTEAVALRLAEQHLTGDEHRAVCMYQHRQWERHNAILEQE